MCAAENADNSGSHILETFDVDNDIKSSLSCADPAVPATYKHDNTLLLSILPPRAIFDDDLAAACPSLQHVEASIYTPTLFITANSRLQKHLHVCRDRPEPARALRPESQGPGGQDARHWNQGQENLVNESCLD